MVTGRQVGAALGFVALGAVVALAVNAVTTADNDGSDQPNGSGEPTPAAIPTFERPDPETNPEAAEFFDLVTAFQDVTLHATYRFTASAGSGTPSIVEIWQKGGQFRQESTVTTASGQEVGKALVLHLTNRTVLCQQPLDGDYVCSLLPESQESTFEALRSGLLAGLGDQEVTVRDDVIRDFTVRCFTIEAVEEGTEPTGASPVAADPGEVATAPNEMCTTAEGVIVTITAPEGSFELVELERDVDEDVFVPPAAPGV